MVGYGVWNKQDMIGWLLEGIGTYVPEATHVRFVFDSCVDNSEKNFDMMSSQILKNVARTSHMTISKERCDAVVHEYKLHNALLRYFVHETNCDVLIVPQDDQRICGPMILRMEGLLDSYGDRIGLIGGRDGYESGLSGIVGSAWSESTLNARLQPGMWKEATFLNSGPLIYTRKVAENVGFIDAEYQHWYGWDDYCMRCKYTHGLVNVVVGTEIRHLKFGKVPGTTYYTDGSQVKDHVRFKSRWKNLAW